MKKSLLIILLILSLAIPSLATVTVETARVQYNCNGILTTFIYPFRILADADLLAVKTSSSGVQSTLALNTDYTVTGSGVVTGGTAVLTAGSKCPAGYTISLIRNIPLHQETDYVDGEAFSAESLEGAIDKTMLIQQQQQEQINRKFGVQASSPYTDWNVAPTAGRVIGFNSSSTGLSTYAIGNITSVDFVNVSDYTSLSDALTVLGATEQTLTCNTAQTLTANITIPANVDLMILKGCSIDTTGFTIDFSLSQPHVTGVFQWLTGSGTVTGLNEARPEWWGTGNNTLASAVASGGHVILGNATYTLTAQVSMSTAKQTVKGNGVSSIIHKNFAGATNAIEVTANDVELANFVLYGNASASYVADEVGIKITGTVGTRIYRTKIHDVEIYNIGSYGIRNDFGQDSDTDRNNIHDVGYAGIAHHSTIGARASYNRVDTITPGSLSNAYGIYWSRRAAADPICVGGGAYFNKVSNIPLWEAIDTHGGNKIEFIGNEITNCKYCISVTYSPIGASEIPPTYNIVSKNLCDAGTATPITGIIISGAGMHNKALGNSVTDNKLIGYGGGGTSNSGAIMFQDSDYTSITGNWLYNSNARAILSNEYNTNFTVSGNHINGIVAGTVGNNAAIVSLVTGDTGRITENTIDAGAYDGIIISAVSDIDVLHNMIKNSGLPYAGLGYTIGRVEIEGAASWDIASIGAGDWNSPGNITVTGAKIGDHVTISAPYDTQGIVAMGYVSATNTVTVKLVNTTGSSVDLGAGLWSARVTRQTAYTPTVPTPTPPGSGEPSLGVLDAFNRADENPVTPANWTTMPFSGNYARKVVSNKMVGTTAGSSNQSYWSAATFGPNTEVTVTLSTPPMAGMYVYLYNRFNFSTLNGYELIVSMNNPNSTFNVGFYRWTGGGLAYLGAFSGGAIAAGDKISFQAVGTSLKAWVYRSGAWVLVGDVTDATYAGAGYIGVGTFDNATQIDDFSGGTIP